MPVVYGSVNRGTRLRRRTSAGSMPISAAKRSTMRSMATAASGRPAPRKAVVETVLVTTETPVKPDVGEVVDAGRHAHRHPRQDGADQRVGARVLHHVELVGGDAPVAACRRCGRAAPGPGRGASPPCSRSGSRSTAPAGRRRGRRSRGPAPPGRCGTWPRSRRRRRARSPGPATGRARRSAASRSRVGWAPWQAE